MAASPYPLPYQVCTIDSWIGPQNNMRNDMSTFSDKQSKDISILAAENARLLEVIQAFNNGMPPMTSKDAAEEVARLLSHADELAEEVERLKDIGLGLHDRGNRLADCLTVRKHRSVDDEEDDVLSAWDNTSFEARTALAKHREMK